MTCSERERVVNKMPPSLDAACHQTAVVSAYGTGGVKYEGDCLHG